ncbi:MAG: thioredoxin family protein [Candidatus Dadabacteria bacterium]
MRFLMLLLILVSVETFAADSTKLYNPTANVEMDVKAALMKAKRENKNVLIQVGGNWCIWCYRFNAFVEKDSLLRKTLEDNYVVYHLNYSKENKNLSYLEKLGYPQRFGFPVMVVLDANGNRLHTQDSGLLEKEKSYDPDKVKNFFLNWSPSALNGSLYKE